MERHWRHQLPAMPCMPEIYFTFAYTVKSPIPRICCMNNTTTVHQCTCNIIHGTSFLHACLTYILHYCLYDKCSHADCRKFPPSPLVTYQVVLLESTQSATFKCISLAHCMWSAKLQLAISFTAPASFMSSLSKYTPRPLFLIRHRFPDKYNDPLWHLTKGWTRIDMNMYAFVIRAVV